MRNCDLAEVIEGLVDENQRQLGMIRGLSLVLLRYISQDEIEAALDERKGGENNGQELD